MDPIERSLGGGVGGVCEGNCITRSFIMCTKAS